jgi:hypothetical protein
MVGVCGNFVTKVQNAAKTLVGATDADVAAAAAQGAQPTTQYASRQFAFSLGSPLKGRHLVIYL